MSLSIRRLSFIAALVLLAAFVPAAHFALANSYVVSSLADDGSAGTLRDAINQANASVGINDTITFSVTGVINLTDTLPPLTDAAGVTIDASSSTLPKVPTVELRGGGTVVGPGIELKSSNNIVRGLAINGFKESVLRLEEVGAGIAVNGHASAAPITNNLIEYCYIGTDLTGNAAVASGGSNNVAAGIVLEYGAQSTTIQNNVISGNFGQGIYLQSAETTPPQIQQNNTIANNKIGVNAAGTQAVPNGASGIFVTHNSNTTTIGPGNVISGNGGRGNPKSYGVSISGSNTAGGPISGNIVKGNLIGTDATGTAAIPNTGDANTAGGVSIGLAQGTVVGGATPAEGNTISGNQADGIVVSGDLADTTFAAGGATIQNNRIGVALDGTTLLANTRSGINIQGATQNNTVSSNTIASNGASGILFQPEAGATPLAPRQNTISANKIESNGANGILVTGSGATGNRITQTTTDANGGKGIALASGGNLGDQPNRPGLSGVTFGGTPPTLAGTITNAASCGGSCTVEVFGGDSALSDEGPVFLGSFTSAGSFSNVSLAACKPFLIFTVTDSAGNTSEFVNPIGPVPTDCVPAAPIVSLSDATPASSQNALPGQTTVFTHTVTNTGATSGTLAISQTSSLTWTTTLDTSACPPALAANQSCTFTLSVVVPADAQAGQSNNTTITAALAGAAVSQQKIDTTTAQVLAAPALDLAPNTQSKVTGPGQPVSFGHTLTNLGNITDTFSVTVAPPSGWSYSVQPTSPIQLAPSAPISVTVTYTPTAGAASPPDYNGLVTARSATDPNVTETVTDTITIVSAAVPQIASAVTPPTVAPGGSVQIDYTITNVGNLTGTFDLSFAGPGWPISDTVPLSLTLNPSASQLISTTLSVPAAALGGTYSATLTATNELSPTIVASKTDPITVTGQGALDLGPDQSFTREPNATYTDTLTLTNNGNLTDTISLAASTPSGWSAQVLSTTVTLNPGGSTQIEVTTTIPPGLLAGASGTTTVTATSSSPGVSDTALITTTIAAVSGVGLAPTPQEKTVLAGGSAVFGFTLTNTGSISQSFTITTTNIPAGWTGSVSPLTIGSLEPGATVPVSLTLTAPAGAPDGTVANVTLTASCAQPNCSASALATARVGQPAGGQIGNECSQAVLPGALVTCRHSITNTSSVSDTFAISLTSRLGWTTSITPSNILVQGGQTVSFTVTLVVPTSAPAGAIEMLMISARSGRSAGVIAQATDTITVLQFAALSFTPSQLRAPAPGQLFTFVHTLQNVGNGLDGFKITATQDQNWLITILPAQTPNLAPGVNVPIQVQVQVPANASQRTLNRITVRATSTFSPSVSAQVTDTIGVPNAPAVSVYIPLVFN